MKIAICDDEIQDIEHLKECIALHSDQHAIVGFLSAHDFLNQLSLGEHFDLLFLDVQMPDADGWEIAKRLKQIKSKIYIAMVTIHGEYIFDCFDRVDWFTPKPITQEKVWKILDKATEKLYPVAFEFQTDKTTILSLTAPEIIYFEVQRNDVFIHTTHGVFKVRLSLKKVKDMLVAFPQFVQVHNSFIINLEHYDRLEKGHVIMQGNDSIKLTRTYHTPFLKALNDFVRNN